MSSFTRFVRHSGNDQERRSLEDHYRRRAEKRRIREQVGTVPSVEQIADPENLIRVFRELKQNAGQAPGVDGVTYADLSATEVGACMRGLSQMVLHGHYRPAPGRLVTIPKVNGKGNRTLSLRNILDRVIVVAVNTALTPFWESVFLSGSMGFRPHRGPWDMLIQLEKTMVETDSWVITIDDIRDAFDHVNLEDLMDDHRRHLQDGKFLDLIEVVLRGGTNQDRKEGIEQGNAYSPTCLNVRLHHAHDLGFNQGRMHPSWLRYADNLVYLTRDVPEGLQVLRQSQALLQSSGFTLKGEDGPPVDLREGQEAHLLGFHLCYGGDQVVYGLDEDAWKGLEQSLEKAHELLNPPLCAARVVRGWIGAYGPAFEGTRREVLERVLRTAISHGFRELATPQELWVEWRSSWEDWQRCRKALCQVS
jgi:retron-type reverse transcriptase